MDWLTLICMAAMQAQDHLFVVGTEEGHIHKCSQAYNSEYLQTYQGMPNWKPLSQQGLLIADTLQQRKQHCLVFRPESPVLPVTEVCHSRICK